MFGRDKIAQMAKELADHLQVIENIKSVKVAQKEMADAIKLLSDRLANIETELKVMRAEIAKDSVHAAYAAVHAVQSSLNERMEGLAVKLSQIENKTPHSTTHFETSKSLDGNGAQRPASSRKKSAQTRLTD